MATLPRHRRRRLHRLVARARAARARRHRPRHRQLLVGQARERRRLRRPRSSSSKATSSTSSVLAHAIEGVEVVFHEAAIPSVPKSMAEPVENHDANATGTLRVLEAARRPACAGSSTPRRRPRTATSRRCPRSRRCRRSRSRRTAASKLTGRVLHAGLRPRLRPGDRLPALLQRVRAAPGSALGIRRRDPEVHHRGARRPAAAHLRRRHAVTRLLPHRQRHRGELGGGIGAGRRRVGRRVQHRLRAGDRPQSGGRR